MRMLMHPTAMPTEVMAPHAPSCTCPGCSSQMETVNEQQPHTPATELQAARAPHAHDAACGCPACTVAMAPSVQREEDHGDRADVEKAGDTQIGAVLSVQEEFTAQEEGSMPDMGLGLAQGGDVRTKEVEETTATAVALGGFTAGGQVGTAPVEVTGRMPDDNVPHAFTNGGQTGTVAWAGGGGAGPRGNENVGSMQTNVVPVYQSGPNPATPGGFVAWIQAGTGRIDVTRSYLGAITGDQGNGQYVSAAAAARFNAHEVQHVNSTSGLYNTHIAPLLLRVTAHHPGGTTVPGATAAAAIALLQTTINWATDVAAFQTNDTAANRSSPLGAVDTADLASGTYPENRGPGTIATKAYTNRVAVPGEVLPT